MRTELLTATQAAQVMEAQLQNGCKPKLKSDFNLFFEHEVQKGFDKPRGFRNPYENITGTKAMHDARYNDLAEIRKLSIACDDCGRRVVWRQHQVAAAQVRHGVHSTVQLGTKLFCKVCQDRGAPGRNISLYVDAVDGLPNGGIPL